MGIGIGVWEAPVTSVFGVEEPPLPWYWRHYVPPKWAALSNYTASHRSTDCHENLTSRMPFSWLLDSASKALEHVSRGLNPTRGMYVCVCTCVGRSPATGRIPCPEESWSMFIKDIQNLPFPPLTPPPSKKKMGALGDKISTIAWRWIAIFTRIKTAGAQETHRFPHTLRTLNDGVEEFCKHLTDFLSWTVGNWLSFDFCCSPWELTMEDFQEVLPEVTSFDFHTIFPYNGREVDSSNPSD